MEENSRKLTPYLSPAGAWALALGTSIGWGSLVITSSTYLTQAGPLGSTLGMIIGGLIMIIISRNYHYMMNCYPEAGGAYAFARDAFGYDHGFLVAWFLLLTYMAMLWANATALPLFARNFIGDIFEFGYMYSIFGYDVYIGEALLSVAAILIVAFLMTRSRKVISIVMIAMVCLFALGITVCFVIAILGGGMEGPTFVPDTGAFPQVLKIAVISPWAFIGFENISHSTEEFSFKRSRVFRILVVSVITTTLLYIFVTLLSVTAYPPQYGSWLEYIRDLGNLSGIEALPAFYAARAYLGNAGTGVLMASLLALVFTSLIGNTLALSRLFYAMGKDNILPPFIAKLNKNHIPSRAIWLVALISIVMPFVGRTAIGWIVDVTTLGATFVYAFVSASAFKIAKTRNDRGEKITSLIGIIIMAGFILYLLIPNLFTTGSMETVSYFLFVVWAVLGFIYFRVVLKQDKQKRFGNSIIVWIALLSLILFVALVWMTQSNMDAMTKAMNHIQDYFSASGFALNQTDIIGYELAAVRQTNARSVIVVVVLVALALGVLLNNYAIMHKRATRSETQLGEVIDMANTDPLTGVKSKHAYAESEKEFNEKIKNNETEDFAVVVCDVNGLKQVNDTLGHKAGDEYIISASRLICELFQHSPVFRTGGDEFVVLLKGRDFENRHDIMKQLHDKSAEHIGTGKVVVSGGLSDFAAGQDSQLYTVFERADALMYEEKKLLKSMGAVSR